CTRGFQQVTQRRGNGPVRGLGRGPTAGHWPTPGRPELLRFYGLSGVRRGGVDRPRLGAHQDLGALVGLRWSPERLVVRFTTATTPGTPCARSAAASTGARSATAPPRSPVRPSPPGPTPP